MADNLDYPGPDDPKAVPPPEGDFPANFFDDVTEPSPPAPPPPRTTPQPQTRLEPEMQAAERVPVRVPQPAPPPPPPTDERRRTPVFPIVAGVLMLGALTGAWFLHKQSQVEPPRPAAPPTTAAPAPAPDESSRPAQSDALASELKDIKSRLADLETRVKGLHGKVEDQRKPDPAPDLKPVQGKLDDLTKSVAAVVPLSEKVGKLDERVGSMDAALKSIREESATLAGEVKKINAAAAARPAVAAAEPVPKPEADDGAAIAKGRELFKAGKYREAAEAFKRLEASKPKDARVYYFAALSTGAATGDWNGEAVKLVTRGMELEKAGSPRSSEIDTAFADMPPQLKPWLDAYRRRAR